MALYILTVEKGKTWELTLIFDTEIFEKKKEENKHARVVQMSGMVLLENEWKNVDHHSCKSKTSCSISDSNSQIMGSSLLSSDLVVACCCRGPNGKMHYHP